MAALTVPAPKIEVGDIIDGRAVRAVTGRKKQTVTATFNGANQAHSLGSLTFSGHVVVAYFTDDGPPKRWFGSQTVEVQRGAGLAEAA